VSRFAQVLALGAVTVGLLAASAGTASAGTRHGSVPPQQAAVSGPQAAGTSQDAPSGVRHTS
jgi:hypothetical protein